MATLTILRGCSGSGKSTWARRQDTVVISRDDLRASLFGNSDQDYYQVSGDILRTREETVTKIEHASIRVALNAGIDVISDNTNLRLKFVKALVKIGQQAGADIVVKEFDVSFQEAVQNNEFRYLSGGRRVPSEVISNQHQAFQSTKGYKIEPVQEIKPYNGTPGKPKAVLVDIDGTLAEMTTRGPFDWSRVGEDFVHEHVLDCVNSLSYDYQIIVMSGRDSVCFSETYRWLEKNDVNFDKLYMRAENDYRPDNIIKTELFDKYVRNNYDVRFALDDRDQVVATYRKMGLPVFQVNYGDF